MKGYKINYCRKLRFFDNGVVKPNQPGEGKWFPSQPVYAYEVVCAGVISRGFFRAESKKDAMESIDLHYRNEKRAN